MIKIVAIIICLLQPLKGVAQGVDTICYSSLLKHAYSTNGKSLGDYIRKTKSCAIVLKNHSSCEPCFLQTKPQVSTKNLVLIDFTAKGLNEKKYITRIYGKYYKHIFFVDSYEVIPKSENVVLKKVIQDKQATPLILFIDGNTERLVEFHSEHLIN